MRRPTPCIPWSKRSKPTRPWERSWTWAGKSSETTRNHQSSNQQNDSKGSKRLRTEKTENPYTAKELGASTWPDFEVLFTKHNGVWGGCWCMFYHKPGNFV